MTPHREHRPPQLFLAIEAEVTRETLPQTIGSAFGELAAWLGEKGIEPVGPPFVRYLRVPDEDSTESTLLQVAFPVGAGVAGDSRVIHGVLPGGEFLTWLHAGPWCDLHKVTAAFLKWAEDEDLAWKLSDDGRLWAARLEIYLNDPESEPDPAKRLTELAFLLEEERVNP